MTCRAIWDLDYHGDDDDHRHSNDVGEGDDEDADLQWDSGSSQAGVHLAPCSAGVGTGPACLAVHLYYFVVSICVHL